MKVGHFAIHLTNIVAIKGEPDSDYFLVEIVRSLSSDPLVIYLAKKSELQPFTEKSANELLKKIDKKISKLNIRKHTIKDCLNYI